VAADNGMLRDTGKRRNGQIVWERTAEPRGLEEGAVRRSNKGASA
jgi:hypothetical protein